MFEDIIEIWSATKQGLAPLRLTNWQLAKLFAAQINRDNPILAKLAILFLVGLFLYVISAITRPKTLDKVLGLPVLRGSRHRKEGLLDVVKEGRQMYPETPYIIDAAGLQYVVYPPAFFDEIKRLPEKEASAQDFFRTISHGYVGTETDALCKTIAVDLARSIPNQIPSQQKNARIAFDKYVAYCPEYKSLALFETLMKIAGSMNASSFVGRETGTHDWPGVVQQLLQAVYLGAKILSWVPRLFQPIFQPLLFLPALKTERGLRQVIAAAVRRDMDEYERAPKRKERPAGEGKLPFTQWLMARYEPSQATQEQLTTDHLLVSIESTLKTATVLYNILLELAQRPHLQDELRHEVEEASGSDGQLPSTNLKELRKMDSMMRETARVRPFSLFTLYRKTSQPLQLSTGPLLPAGTILCVDSYHINNSATAFPNPQEFDPFRFLNKRRDVGKEHMFQYVSTGPSDPNWGDGTQACPGRFFANSIIKVYLTHLLIDYNIKLGDSRCQQNVVNMPNGIFVPDIGTRVLFQSRK